MKQLPVREIDPHTKHCFSCLQHCDLAIDMETDRLIQLTIRSAFKDATVLTIAHRLHTILDSTKYVLIHSITGERFASFLCRILVLSKGRLQEFDEPARLAADPRSAFSKLLRDANIQYSNVPSLSQRSEK